MTKKSNGDGWKIAGWIAVSFLPMLIGLGAALDDCAGAYVYGVTPAELAAEPLTRTPKQLAHDLSNTSVKSNRVRANFLVKAGRPYEHADFEWNSKRLDEPSSLRLYADREAENGPVVMRALSRHLRAMHGTSYVWSGVSFNVDDKRGDVWFKVDPFVGQRPNPLFARQVEAAREVLLDAAFNVPMKVSEREVEDVLGGGYPTGDLAKLDTTTHLEQARAAVLALFPGAASSTATQFEIAIDHPLVSAVDIDWYNGPSGTISSVRFTMVRSFDSSRAMLESCLEKKLGSPRVLVTNYAAGTKSYTFPVGKTALTLDSSGLELASPRWDSATGKPATYEPASWKSIFGALDACRDSAEIGANNTH